MPTPETLTDADGANLRVLRGLCRPSGDLDGGEGGEDPFVNPVAAEKGPRSHGDPFAGCVMPASAPALLPDGSPHPYAGRDSTAEAQERLEVRRRIDRQHRQRWARLLDSLGPEKRPLPHRWIAAHEIADLESGTTMAARADRLKHRPAIFAVLASAVAAGDFKAGSIHWLPEDFTMLRAEGLRHPQLRMTPDRIVRLARLYFPDGTDASIFENPDVQKQVVERLVFSVSAYRQWRRDNGKPDDLPPKFGTGVEVEVIPTPKALDAASDASSATGAPQVKAGRRKCRTVPIGRAAELNNRFFAVRAAADRVCGKHRSLLGYEPLAEELAKPEYKLGFSKETIRQILNGSYRPTKSRGIGRFQWQPPKKRKAD
jgi:hypothetical protein